MKPVLFEESFVTNAFTVIEPAIIAYLNTLHQKEITKRAGVQVVIPLRPDPQPDEMFVLAIPHPTLPDSRKWFKKWVGPTPESDKIIEFEDIAQRKAQDSLNFQMNTGRLIAEYPHLLTEGMIRWQGGVYFEGIAVGVSGVQSYFDEVIALIIAQHLKACRKWLLQDLIKGSDGDVIREDLMRSSALFNH